MRIAGWLSTLGLSAWTMTAQAQGCLRWVLRTDVGSPGPRYAHSMSYDSSRGVTVFFGGEYSLLGGDPEYFNDVWEYDGLRWRQVPILGESPSPRCWASMGYVTSFSAGNGPLLDGMRLGQGIGYGGVEIQEWIYTANADGTGRWTPIPNSPARPDAWFPRGARSYGGAVDVDADGDLTTVSHGGVQLADHVVVNHGAWRTELLLGGGLMEDIEDHDNPNTVPGPGLVQLYDGDQVSGTNRGWVPIENPSGVVPANRFQHAAVYDPNRGRVVMFGGHAIPGADRHWELARPVSERPADGASWVRMDWLLPMPQERALAAMVYDEKRQVTILVGGVGGTRYGDTWELVQVPAEISPLPPGSLVGCEARPLLLQPAVQGSEPLRRQWYYLDMSPEVGGKWVLVDETGAGLTVTRLHAGEYTYRLEVTDACDNTVSRDFTVAIHGPPLLDLAFERIDACPGDSRDLEASVQSTLPVTVQWYRDGRPVGSPQELPPGSHTPVLRLANLTPADTGRYSLFGVNACGQSTDFATYVPDPTSGLPATPNLRVGPRIVTDPVSTTAAVCASATLGVLAEGVGTLRYEWRLDGAPLTNDSRFVGIQSSSLFIRPLLQTHGGDYDVIVWDDCGRDHAVTSRVATLTITPGPAWYFRSTNGPPARFGHTLAYDTARRVTVLFGGSFESPTSAGTYNDLWEWDGTRWAQRAPQSPMAGWSRDLATGRWDPSYQDGPVARTEHAMSYDSRRGRIVVFGGATVDPGGFERRLNDTWEWDGTRWEFRGTNGPGWRTSASLAYHGPRARTVLVGGSQAASDPALGAIWEWDGTAWRIDSTRVGPAGVNTASLAYDSFRDVLVFGPTAGLSGVIHDHFWSLAGVDWTVQSGAFHIGEPAAAYGALVFDESRRRSVYTFGTKGGTGSWDGGRWLVHTNLPAPRPRFAHATAYDSHRRTIVLFGGSFGFDRYWVNTNDTWEFIALDLPLFTDQPASQYRKAGETILLQAAAAVPPGLVPTHQWLRNGLPLADDARISGATSDTLRITGGGDADAGQYRMIASCDCGKTASLPAIVTLDPALQIFPGSDITTLIWSDSNAILQRAESAAGPWITVPGAASPFHPATLGSAGFFRLDTGTAGSNIAP